MSLTKSPYKGTRDFFPAQMRQRDFLFHRMRETAELFSYEPYDGPMVEEVELYLAKSGEELITEQIYSFIDRGERKVAIRPEMTPTVARMVAQIHKEVPKPLRWYSIPNLMRYEKPQRGRLREHWQFNCDIFGAADGLGEIEILQVVTGLLRSFGANEEHFEVLLNDRRVVDAVFNRLLQLDKEKSQKLYKIIDKSKKVTSEALDKMVAEVLSTETCGLHFKEYLALNSFPALITFLERHGLKDSAGDLLIFIENLSIAGLSKFVIYDPTIVRGLDYYTGMVFEIFDKNPENRRAICGGGAYANLLQIFNEDPLPGVGFGLGDVTLADFLKTHGLLPDFPHPEIDLLIAGMESNCQGKAQELAQQLRLNGIKTEVYLGEAKPKKIFQHTERRGHTAVVFIGGNELSSGTAEFKRQTDQAKQTLALDNIPAIMKFVKEK